MQKLLSIAGVTLASLLLPITATAQTSKGGFPIETNGNGLKSAVVIPTITMPKADFSQDKKNAPRCGNRFAHKFKVDINVKEQGVKTEGDGYNIWRLAIASDSARSLNLIFNSFEVPEGARLFLYSPDKEQMLGAYTNSNNTPFNFAISPIDGDKLIVDYEEPQAATNKATLTIKSVNHDYRGLKTLDGYGTSELCETEAATDTIHLGRQSACLLLINGESACSGNLINNTKGDSNPYIVTAGHCFWNTDEYGNQTLDTTKAQTTIAFFNYESPSEAWPIEGSAEMSISGGHTVASRYRNDMLLIRMNEVPPVDYRTYQAGWSREETVEAPLYDFHFPDSDVKKISLEKDNPSTQWFSDPFVRTAHWRLYRWDQGMTEEGSSGSGLFDKYDHLVGGLTGGNTSESCEQPGDDYFWKYYLVWDDNSDEHQNLGLWLDPLQSGVTTLDGEWTYNNPCKRITHRSYNEVPAVPSTANYNFAVGTNNLGITEVAEKFALDTNSTLYGVYFFPIMGNSSKPVYVRIYSGDSVPEELLYEQQIKIQNAYYNTMTGKFGNETINTWSGKENYIHLDSAVEVGKHFFVAYSVPTKGMGNNGVFALYYSEAKKDSSQNTAFYKDSDKQWQPYTNHPTLAAPTSIMTDVVVRDGWDLKDSLNPELPEIPVDPKDTTSYPDSYQFYPAFTYGELNFGMPKGEELHSIQIVDMNGHTLYKKDGLTEFAHYKMDVSDFCLEKNTYIVIAKYKYAEKTFRFVKWREE